MLTTLAIMLGFGLLVGFHEAAHMLTSKLFGVKVKKFALGFGPVLLAKTIGETSYELRLLPIGGFVQCDGENPLSNVKRGFFSLPWYKRALIALAGPVASLFLGYAMLALLFIFGRGWPILGGLHQAYVVSKEVILVTLGFLVGHVPKDMPQGQGGLSGPVMIVKILSDSLKASFVQFGAVLSIISLSLGLFNLFPLPALDGGHVFLYTIEGIRGKKFQPTTYAIWNMLGFALLLALMLYTIFSDVGALLK